MERQQSLMIRRNDFLRIKMNRCNSPSTRRRQLRLSNISHELCSVGSRLWVRRVGVPTWLQSSMDKETRRSCTIFYSEQSLERKIIQANNMIPLRPPTQVPIVRPLESSTGPNCPNIPLSSIINQVTSAEHRVLKPLLVLSLEKGSLSRFVSSGHAQIVSLTSCSSGILGRLGTKVAVAVTPSYLYLL